MQQNLCENKIIVITQNTISYEGEENWEHQITFSPFV